MEKDDVRKLQGRLAELQGQLRQAVADVDRLEGLETPTADDEAKLPAARQAMNSLADDVEEAKAELDAANLKLSRQRAAALATAPSPLALRVPRFETLNEADPAETWGYDSVVQIALDVMAAATGASTPDRLVQAERMAAASTMTTRGEEGFMIPPAFAGGLHELILARPGLVSDVDAQPTSAPSVTMDADESTPWGSTGVEAHWTGEGRPIETSRLQTEGRTVGVSPIKALLRYSEELAADAPRLQARIDRKVPEVMAWKIATAVFEGSGVMQPRGILGSPALITVPKEGAQPTKTITRENVKKMLSRRLLVEGAAPAWTWLANLDAFEQLSSLTWTDDGRPMLTPAPGRNDGIEWLLAGYPLRWSELSKPIGEAGDLLLYRGEGYALYNRATVEAAQSAHVFFDTGEMAWRFSARVGGQTKLSAPVTPPAGANSTRSDFVVLAKR
ncbi:MAG: phage major capsid protein [Pseudomonadota bacterium]